MSSCIQNGFIYWLSTSTFEISYAKDTGGKGIYTAVFAPNYNSFVAADLSGSVFHVTFAGIFIYIFVLGML